MFTFCNNIQIDKIGGTKYEQSNLIFKYKQQHNKNDEKRKSFRVCHISMIENIFYIQYTSTYNV